MLKGAPPAASLSAEWKAFIKGLVNRTVSAGLERDSLAEQLAESRKQVASERRSGKEQLQVLQNNADYQAEQLMDLQNQV